MFEASATEGSNMVKTLPFIVLLAICVPTLTRSAIPEALQKDSVPDSLGLQVVVKPDGSVLAVTVYATVLVAITRTAQN